MTTTATKSTRKTVTAAEFDDVKHRLAELRALIAELQRKSRGTTEANARVAGLEAQVEAITNQLKLNGERFNASNDPLVKEAVSDEIARLNKRIEEFSTDINMQLEQLRTDVEQHTGLLAEHGAALGEQGTRLGMVEEGQSSLHERVETISAMGSVRIPWWQVAIAAAVGVIAFSGWKSHMFSDSFVLANKQVVTVPYAVANSWWTALFIGIAAAALALGLLLVFTGGRKAKTETTTTRRDEVTTTPPLRVVNKTTTVPADMADTKVEPAVKVDNNS